MKTTILFISAALLASPVFAADRCSDNLQRIDESMQSTNRSDSVQEQAMRLQEKAAQAQEQGNTQACVAMTEKALKLLKASSSS
ncbi:MULTISPECIES: hypothetical protein [Pseudomonas]|jgi:hypothetical protein|uniref:Uncharacterized protein n=1 Tax=Pseudomonas citronellolis TaxID=53408 RepID=A0A127N0J3_9PSED|nr:MULTISPECIES: hypothetical protein [Pseudomonas]KSW25843.1 hypothetical protein AOX63_19430 [Pseudomonas sp. ADP]AMO78821.1 hypothetical protein PcP3B5_54510 [Pseudomonas citronellolis]ANI17464.1 hypothetical protein A9C11_27285 [Pseudomonas citronellolis]KES24303.1 hypothetical protein FG99_11140 [Pseudomonas sp. AAC]KRV79873.1 hypothetical protein AO742_09800 [Pseudomonas citronellolis]